VTPRISLVFSAVLAGVLLICVAYWSVARTSAEEYFNRPGDTWANGWLSGEEIHFLASGQYASRTWTDIGDLEEHRGTWARAGDTITLNPDAHGEGHRTLRVATVGKCTFLATQEFRPTDKRTATYEAYSRWPQRCTLEL
jgi:hypothetical protein